MSTSEVHKWNRVHVELARLYENWARYGVLSPRTLIALVELMLAYDEWLD